MQSEAEMKPYTAQDIRITAGGGLNLFLLDWPEGRRASPASVAGRAAG
jgi:alpha-L-fucosidase